MKSPRRKLRLNDISTLASTLSQRDLYNYLGYSYRLEKSFNDRKARTVYRQKFMDLFEWKSEPQPSDVFRLFNQINSYYAEEWASTNTDASPQEFMMQCNQISLFEQAKNTGIRKIGVSFGYRKHLDFMDPRRKSKWLVGVGPGFVEQAICALSSAIENSRINVSLALGLSMAFIAIHPFSDANGRVGRLLFNWLCRKWGLPLLWLNEDQDGELLRTGRGLKSTEYLMAMYMICLAEGRNVVVPDGTNFNTSSEQEEMYLSLVKRIAHLSGTDSIPREFPALDELINHLHVDGHLIPYSPRFLCLSRILN